MIDVIPPESGYPSSSFSPDTKTTRRGRIASSNNRPTQNRVSIGPKIVRVAWKLPARLRRPVRQEIIRQRKHQRRRRAIVQFKRHALYDDVSRDMKATNAPGSQRLSNHRPSKGNEIVTNDIYIKALPGIQVGPPPYAGAAVNKVLGEVGNFGSPKKTAPARGDRGILRRSTIKQRHVKRPEDSVQTNRMPVQTDLVFAKTKSVNMNPNFLIAERDVPFTWGQGTTSTSPAEVHLRDRIVEPKRRFTLPLHLSIWPGNRSDEQAKLKSIKKKLRTRAQLI